MARTIDLENIKQRSWTSTINYGVGEIVTYNLSIGAQGIDLLRCWEAHPQFHALPTFASLPVINMMGIITRDMADFIPGFKPQYHVHGEHYLEQKKLFPKDGAILKSTAKVIDVVDRRSGVTVCVGISTIDVESGTEITYNEWTSFLMTVPGAGASTVAQNRGMMTASFAPPNRQPDAIVEHKTTPEQAALYRAASGEWNPMHIDPAHGKEAGFPGPILSGTCTIGIGVRHVIDTFGAGDSKRFRSVKLRLSKPVFPGQAVKTEMWSEDEGKRVVYRQVAEDGRVVISQAAVWLWEEGRSKI
jgi:acyl dehydratase